MKRWSQTLQYTRHILIVEYHSRLSVDGASYATRLEYIKDVSRNIIYRVLLILHSVCLSVKILLEYLRDRVLSYAGNSNNV